MNEAMTKNMEIINGLNQVEGFDPSAFLRRLIEDTGEEQLYLDVKYRKLWFRLKYPHGKITKRIVKLENDFAIIESKVYLDRNDAEDSYISCAMAQRWRNEDTSYGNKFVESAETAAVGRALADAGFGIQFSEPGEEQDDNPVDAPVPVPKETSSGKEEPKKAEKSDTDAEKPKADPSMSVEELLQIMTLDDAKQIMIPTGCYKGQSLGELAVEKPSAVAWYVDTYRGNNNMLRAAARILIEAAAV